MDQGFQDAQALALLPTEKDCKRPELQRQEDIDWKMKLFFCRNFSGSRMCLPNMWNFNTRVADEQFAHVV